ncbi:UDP-glucose 4-epimerase GalE [Arthrobacter sp. zg-Y916]|uniref:UDP-glucose 4-epimerase n=1 Tax=Arthrobacter caoxuetaonis TaxID=2886935 RepID=A0A9X1MB15_9MICC|nr:MULTISPECIES: UDP-glucose 4-epimerase GalE [Arthrobacter]MCC3296679.1 UDP-glucose 4-epimerase GalE [Arthrobacter caoxuetaonis]MCC9192769.1 UDP-glucose 4-epimerase GalE [Arthrobacter sp. zg-Y916]USQ56495.1 UDP-glucose 4-epimerase GalE [Arthrobacter caoxuetaonis]
MRILVTGGTGYIGSHTTLELLNAGHDVVVMDNLANSSTTSLERVAELAGRTADFVQADLLDPQALEDIFATHSPDAVIHFAGLKAVGESVAKPLHYYRNNVAGTLNLLEAMDRHDVRTIVFSSSATVYGASEEVPLVEKMPMDAVNPYGRTKEQIEDILADLGASDERWSIALLRYFNPVGAHESGRIGEDPTGVPNNLLPFVAQVAVGRREKVMVFGNDYPTPDGTGVRDYIHVVDLAAGHLAALDYIAARKGVKRWNLGTGNGSSVLQVLAAFSKAAGKDVPYEFAPRRPGDAAVSYADPSAALAELGWSASRSLDDMCRDHWNWQKQNPQGYAS